MSDLRIGTCSWNYPSWIGLVYTHSQARSYQYLHEYASRYRTVEVDSWFYGIPSSSEVEDYLTQVDEDFSFSCKAPQDLSLTHQRNRPSAKTDLLENPAFLSRELLDRFINGIRPMFPRLDAINLEFEYLNRQKMPDLHSFLSKLEVFMYGMTPDLPLAIETRNKNYLHEEYFSFLRDHGLIHVFSEKLYMPPVYEVYGQFKELLSTTSVIRLLGGDRKRMEEKTGSQWNALVEEREDLGKVSEMIQDMLKGGHKVRVYVNNHYEGSAPKTIEKLKNLLDMSKDSM